MNSGQGIDEAHYLRRLKPGSPKRKVGGGHTWFDYYAGYPDDFVSQVIAALDPPPAHVLDPWNGVGTTTSVAAERGIGAFGFDINPAAVVVAKARLIRSDVAESLMPLCDEILASAADADDTVDPDELLCTWMDPRGAALVRRLERTIARVLIPADAGRLLTSAALDQSSSLASLFLLVLFRAVRKLLARFRTSNPTWIRLRIAPSDRVNVTRGVLGKEFRKGVAALIDVVRGNELSADGPQAKVRLASSNKLPIRDNSVDAIVTSPPYCTRIDYAVAMAPELAALGMHKAEWTALRKAMIGTSAVSSGETNVTASSLKLGSLLRAVRKHDSYAAAGYYLPFYVGYFSGMRDSIQELQRVMKSGSPVVMVVQDSYFKDVHVDTPAILTELASEVGWEFVAGHGFEVRTRAAMHPHRRSHRQQVTATETVLVLHT